MKIVSSVVFTAALLFVLPSMSIGQSFSGRVTDIFQLPIQGALITVRMSDESVQNHYSDENGQIFLENVPYGKMTFEIYKEQFTTAYLTTWNNIQTRDELQIILEHEQAVLLDSMTILASTQMADFDGIITMNRAQYKTMAGSFQDPSRVVLHFPGFSTDNDGTNAFIFRGLPGYSASWQLSDAEIVNPNHLITAGNRSDALSVNSGGVNVLSSSVIGNYSFTPAVSSIRQNNSIGGVSHIELANKLNNFVDLSLIGAEAGYCFKYKNKHTYATARYSFIGLLEKMGVPFGNESIDYQDFSLVSELIKTKKFTIKGYGIYGQSSNIHRALTIDEPKSTFKDFQDISYKSKLGIAGFSGKYNLSKWQFLQFSLNYSVRKDDNESSVSEDYPFLPSFNINSQHRNSLTSAHVRYQQINGIHRFNGGFRTSFTNYIPKINSQSFSLSHIRMYPYAEYDARWKGWQWSAGLALHTFLKKELKTTHTLNYSASVEKLFSNQMFVRFSHRFVDQQTGNSSLFYNFIHAKTFASEVTFGKLTRIFSWKITGFYNDVRGNNAVLSRGGGLLSTFNGMDYGLDVIPAGIEQLNNAASSGVDIWAYKSFSAGRNFLEITGNIGYLQSKYQNEQKSWLPAKTDIGISGGFSAYFIIQRKKYEWNLGCLFHGRQGIREYEYYDGEIISFWDISRGMNIQQNPYSRLDVRAVFTKKGGKKRQHRISLDVQNILNKQNPGFQYFDYYLQQIIRTNQLGLIPVLGYRFEY
jgi:hypothetical protein